MKKEIKIEWCENFIRKTFKKFAVENGGIETGCFFKMAEKAGLYIKNTYGSPMSVALSRLTTVETVSDENGNYCYTVFRLA